jgi:ADP-L-glycero-D-manno-heptose 6-epimerase
MIVVTGAAGFIGSCLVKKLNEKAFRDIVIVDDFSKAEKYANFEAKAYKEKVDRKIFTSWLKKHFQEIEFIFHIGARTDTAEFDVAVFDELNLNYSKAIWNVCTEHQIPLIYASSAATYGLGEFGFSDDHEVIYKLKPLNPYGESKNDFDKWAVKQKEQPPYWAGLKFFNVYGPNEYHKGRMASVIFHAFRQIIESGKVKLFRSHNPEYEDGKQLRDFIYVKDLLNICIFLMETKKQSGLFNVGTGKARTFIDLVSSVFSGLNMPPNIYFVDTPIDIRDKYQYFTEANMGKLLASGYNYPFYSLEEGIKDYIQNYLEKKAYL